MADRIPMTRAGYVKLEGDLKQLKSVERPQDRAGDRGRASARRYLRER